MPLIRHQLVRWRLWEMWRKLEICRAAVRRAAAYDFSAQGPHILSSIAAKTTATQTAHEIVLDAQQIFGAKGLARDAVVESCCGISMSA